LPHDNFINEEVQDLTLHDLREEGRSLCFEENGIAVLEMHSALAYEDFSDRQKVEEVYCKEVADALLMYMDASSVQVFDFALRRRHEEWPEKPSYLIDGGGRSQPARQVHIDANEKATRELIETLNPTDFKKLLSGRFMYLNIWRPLHGPLKDWPLAVCDAASVEPSRDLKDMDNVLPNDLNAVNYVQPGDGTNLNVAENVLAHYSPAQRWYYLSDHQPSELLIFRQVDSAGKSGVPHASFYQQPLGHGLPRQRESVEVRALVYFDD